METNKINVLGKSRKRKRKKENKWNNTNHFFQRRSYIKQDELFTTTAYTLFSQIKINHESESSSSIFIKYNNSNQRRNFSKLKFNLNSLL